MPISVRRIWASRSSHPTLAVSSSHRRFAPRSSRSSPRSPWPAAPAAVLASAWCRYTSRRAGVGFAVHRLAHSAVHECPEKCGQLRALRHALVPAQVRTLVRAPPPEPPAPCRALRLSVVSAPPAAQSPRRHPSAGFAGTVSPIVDAASRCLHGRRRRLVLTPHALAAQSTARARLSCRFSRKRRQRPPGCCWIEWMLISIRVDPLESLPFGEADAEEHTAAIGGGPACMLIGIRRRMRDECQSGSFCGREPAGSRTKADARRRKT